ncbi:Major Facilitator Superfamily (MFS) [Pseudoloma neurophilia]|uniref:Major Facilitator Superfamily (MFS) n=1 Tax=Pseudoloma neurophilia TaxID=146866 RepID=A0A0R0LWE1_9MICR|nr:Major Facilitator Superfamily (MFS) [Pseudoloma neurophilia]
MEEHIIFLFHFCRSFIPIYPFILPYLTNKKEIKIRDFHGCLRINFIGNLFFNIFGQIFICFFSSKTLLIIESICELSFYAILFSMKKKNIKLLHLGILLHSAGQSFAMITKDLLYVQSQTGNDNKSKVYATYNLCKKLAGIFSSFIGQDLLFYTGNFKPLLIFSVLSCICTLSCSFLVLDKRKVLKDSPVIDDLMEIFDHIFYYNPENTISKGKVFNLNYKPLFYMLAYTIGSLIYICFNFYGSNIFLENKEEITRLTIRFSDVLKWLLKPIRIISICYNFILRRFVKYEKEQQSIVLHGYIDGIARLTAILFSHLLLRVIRFSHEVTLSVILISIFLTFLMARRASLFVLYSIYILNVSMANLIITSSGHQFRNMPNIGLIFGIICLFTAILHVIVSSIGNLQQSKQKKTDFEENLESAVVSNENIEESDLNKSDEPIVMNEIRPNDEKNKKKTKRATTPCQNRFYYYTRINCGLFLILGIIVYKGSDQLKSGK